MTTDSDHVYSFGDTSNEYKKDTKLIASPASFGRVVGLDYENDSEIISYLRFVLQGDKFP